MADDKEKEVNQPSAEEKVVDAEEIAKDDSVKVETAEETEKSEDKADEGEGKTDEGKDEPETSAPEGVDWKDKYLRLHADWENYRKRMDEQRADERIRANESLISELLPILDDMHHALEYADKNGEDKLLEGFKQISLKFSSSLEKHGLEEINPKGEAFDPIFHQAVGTVEDDSVFDETVEEVYQKGYKLGNKVLRTAMVTYSTGGEKRPVEKEENE